MKIQVLLVDDEKDFLEALADRLESKGLGVVTALSGEEALERLREAPADVVVLDLLMPGMDGIGTLQAMKRLKPLVEVILLSGNASVENAVEGMKLGAYDFIMKPAETRELLKKIALAYQRKAEQEDRIRHAEIQRILLHRGRG